MPQRRASWSALPHPHFGLALALQLGAAIGASIGRGKDPAGQIPDRKSATKDRPQLSSPPPIPHTTRGDQH